MRLPGPTMSITGFSFPTPIKFGAGARKLVAQAPAGPGLKRPLIVTDRALAALPVLAEFQTHLAGWTWRCSAACSATPPAAR
jgi:alcohol dehydrogenase class IV